MVIVNAKADLFEVITATHSASGFPSRLHGREQEPDQNANNGDDNEQFYKRKTTILPTCHVNSFSKDKTRKRELPVSRRKLREKQHIAPTACH